MTYKLAPYCNTTNKFIIGNINIKSARIITIIKSSSSLRCSRFNINATNGEFKICAAIKNFCRVKFCDETTITRGFADYNGTMAYAMNGTQLPPTYQYQSESFSVNKIAKQLLVTFFSCQLGTLHKVLWGYHYHLQ